MLDALARRDGAYEGIFITCVKTTGIFCRPGCPARQPRPENVEFCPSPRDALNAGYRPCRRCRPLRAAGDTPEWLAPLLDAVEADPTRRWRDRDLRAFGVDPVRVRRWFKVHHGLTFHGYSRARRLGAALGHLQRGAGVTGTAFDAGYESLSGFGEAFAKFAGGSPTHRSHRTLVTVTRLASPLGPLVAAATDDAVCLLEFADRRQLATQCERLAKRLDAVFAPGENEPLLRLTIQLDEYFAGARTDFDLPLRAPGTPFQEQVWAELQRIPCGETRSYAQLAAAIGRPTATRAVARANGDNRIAILIPCHRVIGADGKLTGYGGGLWRKQRLLDIEAQV